MTFFYRKGWQVQFLEPDLKTPLPRTFTFADPEKIRELARARVDPPGGGGTFCEQGGRNQVEGRIRDRECRARSCIWLSPAGATGHHGRTDSKQRPGYRNTST